ncbi:MAG: rod shape-determining protein MreC [Aquificae bacterium]|nr:rod shape-determining protein MreC [Aquificota bacterium]
MIQFFKVVVGLLLSNIYTRILFLFIVPIFVLFLVFLSVDAKKGSFLYEVKNIFLTIVYPVQKVSSGIYSFYKDKVTLLKDKSKLIEENKLLKQELDYLRFKIIELKNKEIENEQLKKLLNFTEKNKDIFKKLYYISGKVIGISPDSLFEFVVINLGKLDGVEEGNFVISNGYLAGILNQVSRYSSSVLLVTNKNFKTTVRLRNTREIAFFQGLNKKYGVLKYVKPEQDIRVGDVVETVGFDEYPAGIPIGIVDDIVYEEGNFFKTIKVKVFLNPTKLEYVLVLKKKDEN